VPDTADITEAAGQPDDTALAVADSEPLDGEDEAQNDPWADPAAARKEIEKLRKEAAGYRTKYNEAKPKLTEYEKYLDSQKTEAQKLAEAKEAAEAKLTEVMSANARMMAAVTHNLPADLIDLLGTGTEDEINARAELLAEKFAAASTFDPPASTRPIESLMAGGRPADAEPEDMSMDAVLRRALGR
jgi:septal ring factor EnvC (AmiA/AmiB activator)